MQWIWRVRCKLFTRKGSFPLPLEPQVRVYFSRCLWHIHSMLIHKLIRIVFFVPRLAAG